MNLMHILLHLGCSCGDEAYRIKSGPLTDEYLTDLPLWRIVGLLHITSGKGT